MHQTRSIAIETSGPHGSVALGLGDGLLVEAAFPAQAEHARELLVTLDRLCREAGWKPTDIDECHVSIGPGSFTGLRVAVTFARSLALAGRVKICTVPTLEVIAANALAIHPPPARVAVMLTARRDRVFAGYYELRGDEYAPSRGIEIAAPEAFLRDLGAGAAICGEGVAAHLDLVRQVGAVALDEPFGRPRAGVVLRLGRALARAGRFTPPRELVPLYIRRPEAEEVWEKRASAGRSE